MSDLVGDGARMFPPPRPPVACRRRGAGSGPGCQLEPMRRCHPSSVRPSRTSYGQPRGRGVLRCRVAASTAAALYPGELETAKLPLNWEQERGFGVASLRIDPDAVAAAGSQVAAAGSHSTRLPVMAGPAAADPVSVAIAATLAARAGAVSANSTLGSAVAAHHGGRLSTDAASYVEVDEASAATLGGASGAGALPGAGSLPPLPDFTVPSVPAPAVTGIPGMGRRLRNSFTRRPAPRA